MVELKGTEKQVKWAEDILRVVTPAMELLMKQIELNIEKYRGTEIEGKINKIAKVYENINSLAKSTDAGVIINEFRDYCVTIGRTFCHGYTDEQASIMDCILKLGDKANEQENKAKNIAKQAEKKYSESLEQ